MAEKIAVLGGGAFGTACAVVLARDAEQEVTLWVRGSEQATKMTSRRENVHRLPGVELPESMHVTCHAEEALAEATLALLAIPSKYLRRALEPLRPVIGPDTPVVSGVKGIEQEQFLRPSELVCQVLGQRPVIALGGPAHAEEFAHRQPTSVVAAGPRDVAMRVQTAFSTDRFRVYTSDDLTGVELAGALKNIVAIAAGISDGLGFGDNAKSALLTRAIVEIARFGEAFGADAATFSGLAGIGDLITTCVSPYGRNRRVGIRLGQGETAQEILDEASQSEGAVAEGVTTAPCVDRLARQRGIKMPITRAVTAVLFERKAPSEATEDLMLRPLGSEREDG